MSPLDPRDIAGSNEEATRRFFAALAGRLDRSLASPTFSESTVDQILAALDSGMIAQTFDSAVIANASEWGITMVDGRHVMSAVLVREAVLAIGVAFFLHTAGVYTADNNNKVGLVQLSADEASMDVIAASDNDGNLFKTAGLVQRDFADPVALPAGLYWISLLWNASATTTAPVMAGQTPVSSGLRTPLFASAKKQRAIAYESQTNLIDHAADPVTMNIAWAALY